VTDFGRGSAPEPQADTPLRVGRALVGETPGKEWIMIEFKRKVEVMPPAYVLKAARATGCDCEEAISWDDLRGSEVGKLWAVEGGGELFSESASARLVYKDEESAVLMVRTHHEANGEVEDHASLVGFAF